MIGETLLTPEIVEDEKLFWDMVAEYIRRELKAAFKPLFLEQLKIDSFEFLYGEGSYEEFIFGGAPGL